MEDNSTVTLQTAPIPKEKPHSVMPYVWATVILVLLAVIMIGVILFLRPEYDALIVVTAVLGFTATTIGSVAAVIKSQATHESVNSQLTAWKGEFFQMAYQKGIIKGTLTEQERIAEKVRLTRAEEPHLPTGSSAVTPTPVEIISPTPLPVKVEK